MKLYIIVTIFMASILLKCSGQEKKSLETFVDCELLITEQQAVLWEQLASFQSTYFSDENKQSYKWDYDFENNKITVLKNGDLYLNIDFIHVGRVDVIQKSWTWANALNKKETKLKEVKEFGIKNNCEKLKSTIWSGDEKDAWNMVAITNHILHTKGGARHYTKTEYNYVVFTKIKKTN